MLLFPLSLSLSLPDFVLRREVPEEEPVAEEPEALVLRLLDPVDDAVVSEVFLRERVPVPEELEEDPVVDFLRDEVPVADELKELFPEVPEVLPVVSEPAEVLPVDVEPVRPEVLPEPVVLAPIEPEVDDPEVPVDPD